MIYKTTKIVVGFALFGLIAVQLAVSSPLVSLGDNAGLFFDGSASIVSDSNIAIDSEQELDDLIFEVKPGFQLVTGDTESAAEFRVNVNYAIRRYADNDQFDSELFSGGVSGVFRTPKSVTTLAVSYVESQTNSRNQNTEGLLVESDTISAHAKTDFRSTLKTSVVAGVDYSDRDNQTVGADYSELAIPVNLYYAYSEKLDIGLGYRFRNTSIDRVFPAVVGDRDSNFFNVAMRGELSPKLVTDIKLGYQTTSIEGVSEDTDGFSIESSFTYTPNVKTVWTASIEKDLIVGFNGEIIDSQGVLVNLDYEFNPMFYGNVQAYYAKDEYETDDREQDFTYLKLGVFYKPSEYLLLSGSYVFQENDGKNGALSFSGNILTISADVTY